MNISALLKEELIQILSSKFTDIVLSSDDFVVEHPSKDEFGDYSTNIAMVLAKKLHKSPMTIAEEITKNFNPMIEGSTTALLLKTEIVAPGFINMYLSPALLPLIINQIVNQGDTYGSIPPHSDNLVILEYSSPNTNKAQHIGHARNNFIGSSLALILSFAGYSVKTMNYVGDIGVHICKSMLMYMKYGNGELPDIKPDHFVGKFYERFQKEVELNPDLNAEALALLNKWEAGDEETHLLWEKLNSWVYEGWKETYDNLNAHFDIWDYESANVDKGGEIVKETLEKGVAVKDVSGAVIAMLEEHGLPNKVLLRSDGTSLYAAKDLQLATEGYRKYGFEKRIYVVDERQGDYLKQVFKIIELLGYDWSKKLFHLGYGVVDTPQGKLSSRKGNVISADEVYEALFELEVSELQKGGREVTSIEDTARKIALAAFRYGMLKIDPMQGMTFQADVMSRFEGNTGPYIMYTYTRGHSLIEKSGLNSATLLNLDTSNLDLTLLGEKEMQLIKLFSQFTEVIKHSADSLAPNFIANYAYGISQLFNAYYAETPILNTSDKVLRDFRLLIVHSTTQVLKNAMGLLGIDVVEKM